MWCCYTKVAHQNGVTVPLHVIITYVMLYAMALIVTLNNRTNFLLTLSRWYQNYHTPVECRFSVILSWSPNNKHRPQTTNIKVLFTITNTRHTHTYLFSKTSLSVHKRVQCIAQREKKRFETHEHSTQRTPRVLPTSDVRWKIFPYGKFSRKFSVS
jgi:hypothetical protein